MTNGNSARFRGQRVRKLRKANKITQADLASRCGVTLSFISAIERNQSTPGRSVLFKLAEALGASPQYLENGELTPEDQANKARHALWPEIVYVLANHIIVPREVASADVAPDNDGLRAAIDRAFDAPHFCEYRAWAESSKGRAVAREFEGNWSLEELIERTAGKGSLDPPQLWIDLAERIKRERSIFHLHNSAADSHQGTRHPADCFAFDLVATRRLYEDLPSFFWGCEDVILSVGVRPSQYGRYGFRESFVDRAFPVIFWSSARLWSDRRLAGWFWYLDMPADLFGPLARLARQYKKAEEFTANAHRLLDQASVEDRDLFLGLFPDIIVMNGWYINRFGTMGLLGGAVRAKPVYPAFIDALNRREARRTSYSHSLIDLMATLDDEEKLKQCEQALREIAPPVVDTPMGLAVDARKRKRAPKPAREKDRPPETLP